MQTRSLRFWLPSIFAGSLLVPLPGQAQMPVSVCRSSFRIVQTEGPLYVRSYPSLAADVTTSVANGTEVLFNLSDRTGGWAEITLPQGATGWAEARLLAPSPLSGRQFNGYMQIKTLDGGPANLRTGPSLYDEVIALLENDLVVTYNSNGGSWSLVTTPEGIRGYVSNQFLVCTELEGGV
ncbi:MAG: SH3 domain-containing protein [Cyanobacteria bacterium Co-bin13]|nr:SH3 domain-containing protein [Cyanobacteria bacterium Co-bin13]